MNLNDIIKGWSNVIMKDPLYEKLAVERATICGGCPKLKLNSVCGACGCPIISKVRNLSSNCPIGKWKAAVEIKEPGNRYLKLPNQTITLNIENDGNSNQ